MAVLLGVWEQPRDGREALTTPCSWGAHAPPLTPTCESQSSRRGLGSVGARVPGSLWAS